jgi:hypothetical protein
MRPYPLFDIKRGAPKHTILVTANKGIGKSKASYDWLWKMLQQNEGAGVVIIAANIALAKKCESDLRIECKRKTRAGLCLYGLDLFVNYLDAPGGNIKQPRVICCINSLHRVRSSPVIVLVDEADMVLANCNSDLMTNRKQVFMAAERFMGNARVLIAMDAHIDCSRVLEWFYMVRPDSELYPIRNAGVHPSQLGRTATVWRLPKLKKIELTCAPAVARTLELLKSGLKFGVSVSKNQSKSASILYIFSTIKVASFDCGVSGR